MASRQDEKQRRRAEREARERAEAAAESRRKRLRLAVGGALAAAALVAVAALAITGFGGGDDTPGATPARGGVSVPPQRISGLPAAAKAAGCTVRTLPDEGNAHLTKNFKPGDYDTNPPTSGPHNPDWYQDGVYEPGTTPRLGMLVHTLEHGRINLQYRPGTPQRTVRRLEALVNQLDGGYHMLLYQNTTKMPYAVAATTWTHLLGCREMNDRAFDAIRAFRLAYIDKGPETVP